MNALTLTLIRVAFLAVLWLFVIAAIGVVRTDMFGAAAAKVRRARCRAPAQAPRQPQRQARSTRGAPRYLIVTGGALSGMTIDLTDQQITMGRANDATLVLNDDYASSRHARIFPQDGQWLLEELGSTHRPRPDFPDAAPTTPGPPSPP